MPAPFPPQKTGRGTSRGSLRTASFLTRILEDLLKLNVAPLAVFQMLKSMCAGQRLASEPQDPAAVSLPTSSETRGQLGCSLPVTQAAGWRGPGGGQCQAQQAKPSVTRPFCRSSPMTHWTHPRALPFGAVPSIGSNASLESRFGSDGGRMGAPTRPKQARPHLTQPLLTSTHAFMPQTQGQDCFGSYSHSCVHSSGSGQAEALSYNHLP